MKWGRKWGNLWGQDLVSPVKIIDYEELPPVAHVSWNSVADNVLYHVYADGKYYETTSGLEILVQFIDFGRHWVDIMSGGPGSMDEDLTAFVTSIPGTRVKLTWTASGSSDLAYYKIYQKILGVWTYLGRTRGVEDYYITESLVDAVYDFRIDTVDLAENQSTGVEKSFTIARYPDPASDLAIEDFDSGGASFSFVDSESVGVVGYKIYHNSGSGDIDYTTVISTISTGVEVFELTLEAGEWEVGIRAYNAAYEEDNVDEFIEFELGGSPLDILESRPNVPESLAVNPAAGGTFDLACTYEAFEELGKGTQVNFYVNDGAGGSVSYDSTVATATIPDHTQGERAVLEITVTSSALTNIKTYIFGARASTVTGRESNNADTATGVADATTPDNVSGLSAEAVNYEESSDLPI